MHVLVTFIAVLAEASALASGVVVVVCVCGRGGRGVILKQGGGAY